MDEGVLRWIWSAWGLLRVGDGLGCSHEDYRFVGGDSFSFRHRKRPMGAGVASWDYSLDCDLNRTCAARFQPDLNQHSCGSYQK